MEGHEPCTITPLVCFAAAFALAALVSGSVTDAVVLLVGMVLMVARASTPFAQERPSVGVDVSEPIVERQNY